MYRLNYIYVDNNKRSKMKNIGFTLSETLITLGIIGIVAAITLPTLMTKLSDARDSAIIKEDYSILQQMMKSANYAGAIENNVKPNNLEDLKQWFETTSTNRKIIWQIS